MYRGNHKKWKTITTTTTNNMHGFPRCHQSIDLWHGMARGIYVCHAQEGLGTAEWNIVFCTFPFGLLILAREWKISVELETIGPKHELEAPCFFHKQGNCRNGNKYPYLYDPIPATLNIKATPVTHKTQLTQTILQQKQKPSQAQQKLSQKKTRRLPATQPQQRIPSYKTPQGMPCGERAR